MKTKIDLSSSEIERIKSDSPVTTTLRGGDELTILKSARYQELIRANSIGSLLRNHKESIFIYCVSIPVTFLAVSLFNLLFVGYNSFFLTLVSHMPVAEAPRLPSDKTSHEATQVLPLTLAEPFGAPPYVWIPILLVLSLASFAIIKTGMSIFATHDNFELSSKRLNEVIRRLRHRSLLLRLTSWVWIVVIISMMLLGILVFVSADRISASSTPQLFSRSTALQAAREMEIRSVETALERLSSSIKQLAVDAGKKSEQVAAPAAIAAKSPSKDLDWQGIQAELRKIREDVQGIRRKLEMPLMPQVEKGKVHEGAEKPQAEAPPKTVVLPPWDDETRSVPQAAVPGQFAWPPQHVIVNAPPATFVAWEPKSEANGNLALWASLSSLGIRIGAVFLLFFLVKILLGVFRYNSRLAAFNDSRADGLLLVGQLPTDLYKFLEKNAAESVAFDEFPKTQFDELVAAVKGLKPEIKEPSPSTDKP